MTLSFKVILDRSVLECVSRSRKPGSRIRDTRSSTSPSPSHLRLLFVSFRPLFFQTKTPPSEPRDPIYCDIVTSNAPANLPALLPQHYKPTTTSTHRLSSSVSQFHPRRAPERPQHGRPVNSPVIIIFTPAPPRLLLSPGSF